VRLQEPPNAPTRVIHTAEQFKLCCTPFTLQKPVINQCQLLASTNKKPCRHSASVRQAGIAKLHYVKHTEQIISTDNRQRRGNETPLKEPLLRRVQTQAIRALGHAFHASECRDRNGIARKEFQPSSAYFYRAVADFQTNKRLNRCLGSV